VRLLITAAATVAVLMAAGCTAGKSHDAAAPAGSQAPLPADPRTAPALLGIATAFNRDYDRGDYGPVHARWDARSQAIITEADYVRRHELCRSAQPPSRTESASRARAGRGWCGMRSAGSS
jgi:hypothetical protein